MVAIGEAVGACVMIVIYAATALAQLVWSGILWVARRGAR